MAVSPILGTIKIRDEKAIETVKTWKFRPGMHDGSPVPVRIKMAVSFAAHAQSVPLPE